jgi:L-lactate utilization protein LutC
VLGRVRSALARAGSSKSDPEASLRPSASAQRLEPGQRLSSFVQRLESAGGRAYVAADEGAAASHLAAIARTCGACSIALSDSALARHLAAVAGLAPACFDGWSDRERLFAADLGLSDAQAGIAETGSLVLDSRAERHRLVSLVPPVHVAVLRAESIADDLGSALAGLGRGAELASAVTLITGPSRTADIELELVIGVHGPRELHVLVLETTHP